MSEPAWAWANGWAYVAALITKARHRRQRLIDSPTHRLPKAPRYQRSSFSLPLCSSIALPARAAITGGPRGARAKQAQGVNVLDAQP